MPNLFKQQLCKYWLVPAIVGVLHGCAGVSGQHGSPDTGQEEWGVKLVSLRPTASGYMLDLRYRVVDPKKATPIMDRNLRPYLIVEDDGRRLSVPVTNKLGAMRQTTKFPRPNRSYFMLFANPGRHVKSGDRVTVVIGDFKAEHVVVN